MPAPSDYYLGNEKTFMANKVRADSWAYKARKKISSIIIDSIDLIIGAIRINK